MREGERGLVLVHERLELSVVLGSLVWRVDVAGEVHPQHHDAAGAEDPRGEDGARRPHVAASVHVGNPVAFVEIVGRAFGVRDVVVDRIPPMDVHTRIQATAAIGRPQVRRMPVDLETFSPACHDRSRTRGTQRHPPPTGPGPLPWRRRAGGRGSPNPPT